MAYRGTGGDVEAEYAKQGDTKWVAWEIDGFDLTGVSLEGRLRRGATVIGIDVEVSGPPVYGIIRHKLTGTLAPGTYQLEVKITGAGVRATAPSRGTGRLVIEPEIPTP